jgi:hypothetical protein
MITCLASLSTAARTASIRKFYKWYILLTTLHLTETNLPEQYLTQEAALVYAHDKHVTHDNHHANLNHHPVPQPQS